MLRKNISTVGIVIACAVLAACDKRDGVETDSIAKQQSMTAQQEPADSVGQHRKILADLSEKRRLAVASLAFDEYEKTVFREPFEGGKYIVSGDTAIPNKKLLREFYLAKVKNKPTVQPDGNTEFIIKTVGGLDAVWSSAKKKSLTYCVSDAFGDQHAQVIESMSAASEAWEQVADLDFIYVAEEDAECDQHNQAVMFDVRPVNIIGGYLARAFFPNEERQGRNVFINENSLNLNPSGKLTLTGILRHELGHVIGARHEHARPDAGRCFEDQNYRPLTNYDAFSVMHYPQCNGLAGWALELTAQDKNGAACIYGTAPGFSIDKNLVNDFSACVIGEQNTVVSGKVSVAEFANQSVAVDEEKRYGDFEVLPGSRFVATMAAAGDMGGDPDLYVSFDKTPLRNIQYDCRPYNPGAEETCDVIVPDNVSIARVLVHGFDAGVYNLNVHHVEPGGSQGVNKP